MPTSITLKVLHDIVQITMGWLDQHLWEFKLDKQTYGPPMDEDWAPPPARTRSRSACATCSNPAERRVNYLYDFGDSWEHRITVTRVARPARRLLPPLCRRRMGLPARGLRRHPRPTRHARRPRRPRAPRPCRSRGMDLQEWDPKEDIDELPLRIALGRIANRRNAAKARLAKNSQASSAE